MNDEIFNFEKSFKERFIEYANILMNDDLKEPTSSQISKVWSDYLESNIEFGNFRALWNVSQNFFNELQLYFPTIIAVKVDSVDYFSLSVNLTIIDVEKFVDIKSFKIENVPLKDLYITREQENTALDVTITAECLDQLRIFYNHLWRMWDDDAEHEQDKWVSTYLNSRLKLYYDMIIGNLHYDTKKIIEGLIEKYRKTSKKIEDIQVELSYLIEESGSLLNDRSVDLITSYNNLELIRTKMQQWENPELRKILDSNNRKSNSNSGLYLVMLKCEIIKAAEYFARTTKLISTDVIYKGVINNLNEIFCKYVENDIILLTPGEYVLTNSERLDFNVNAKGLCNEQQTIITETYPHWCMLETLADNLIVENLTFDLKKSQTVIFIKEGFTCLNSVIMRNYNKESSRAIIVGENAILTASRCVFAEFDVAVLCLQNSIVELSDCTFQDNNVCVQVFESAQVSINNCDMSETKKIPIRYVGNQHLESYKPLDDLSL